MISSPILTRRTLLGATTAIPAAVVLAACTGGQGPDPEGSRPDRVRVLTGLGFQSWEAYLDVAISKGWFDEVGIQVEVLPGEATGGNLQLLAGGQAEFATLDINAAIIEFSNGTHTDFVLTSVLHANLLACVTVLESSGIGALRDLENRSIAAIPNGTNTVLFPALGPLANFDATSVELVPLTPPFAPYLASGQVDATMEFIPNRRFIESTVGGPVVMFPYAEWIPELYGSGMAVTPALAESKPGLVRRFNQAALRGLRYSVDNPAESAGIFAEAHEGQDVEAVTAGLEQLAPYVRADQDLELGAFDEARLVQSASMLEELGAIDSFVEPADIAAFDLYA